MLSEHSKILLDKLEAKYVNMLEVVNDIAKITMTNSPLRAELEEYISIQELEIHEAASRLSGNP